MKQIAIIMSLAISIFILSGCNGKDDAKKECDEKGADWVWDVTKKECEAAATTKEDCDKKGAGWLWDEANKKCNQSTAGLSDKEKCEAKGAGWAWNENKATDHGEEYKKCTKDVSNDCKNEAVPVVRNTSPLECVAAHYTIINSTGRNISYFGRSTVPLGKGGCDSISREEFDKYNPFGIKTLSRDSTEFLEQRAVTICQTGGEGFNTPCSSDEGIYEVQAGRSGFIITKVDKTVEELKAMGCFEYIISAEGLL